MYGAIIGDLAGSIYEYGQLKKISKIEINKIINEKSFFSDDTILTIAIADAILNNQDYESYLKKYGKQYSSYRPNIDKYFKTPFSPSFMKWIDGNKEGISKGNGAMMRISSVGFLFDNEKDVIYNSIKATIPSHNSVEAIQSAKIVSLIIYYSKIGLTKEEIIYKLNITLIKPNITKFNTTCSETLPLCLYVLFNSNSFEECIINILKYGGDTDTNACIVGSMAEAMYGINDDLIKEARNYLPQSFIDVLDKCYEKDKIKILKNN